jgi:hypothetical protein
MVNAKIYEVVEEPAPLNIRFLNFVQIYVILIQIIFIINYP